MAPLPRFVSLSDSVAQLSTALIRREPKPSITPESQNLLSRTVSTYNPGGGAKSPDAFNNKGFFALFGLLGAGMVLASIWFFFWARNGGFVWREGDWEDYKSTVLRRKGPDGKTLSNATKSTKLGQKSIAGTFTDYGRDEKVEATDYGYRSEHNTRKKSRPHGPKTREPSDEDVRAYRHEKPARVGGMNREADGSHFDFSNTDRSDLGSNISAQPLRPKPPTPKKKSFMEKKREKKEERKQEKRHSRAKPQSREDLQRPQRHPSFTTFGTPSIADTSELGGNGYNGNHNSYYAEYRPGDYRPAAPPYAERHDSPRRQSPRRSNVNTANQSRQSSPRKHAAKPPGSFDAYSEAGSSDTGTKVYTHHIPELSRGSRNTGYRRDAFGGRRDSLSDSDGDLGTRRY